MYCRGSAREFLDRLIGDFLASERSDIPTVIRLFWNSVAISFTLPTAHQNEQWQHVWQHKAAKVLDKHYNEPTSRISVSVKLGIARCIGCASAANLSNL